MSLRIGRLLVVAGMLGAMATSMPIAASEEAAERRAPVVDADAAEILARREGCLKCHGVSKDKEGPSFMKLADKLKDKTDPEGYMLNHLRTGPVVKFSDGEEEDHRVIRSKDEEAVMNLIRWILSR